MAIAALYQVFGNEQSPCIRASARLKDMQNMMAWCGDYFVMHSWRKDGTADHHCIMVYELSGKITVHFYGNDEWVGGSFKHFEFPMDHEIWIGVRPNNLLGSREYNSFTWWVYDKTTDEYAEETRDTPETWISQSVDAALEMGLPKSANGLKKSMADYVVLDKDYNEVYLPDVYHDVQHPYPNGCNCHEEIYSEGGYKAECIQWKTIEGLEEMVLNINSDPQGQEVLIDGENVGLTPVSETVTCTEHDIMVQPSGVVEDPDLWIEDVWVTGTIVSYRIKNIGGAVAGASHTNLKVDGVVKETKVEGGLNPGQSREGSFAHSWECSGTEDSIEVVADCNGEVSEGNEGNNSLQKVIQCDSGCVGIDLTPIEIFSQFGYIAFKVENKGTRSSSTCYHYIYTKTGSSWTYRGRKRAGAQAPNTITSLRSSVYWPGAGTQIKVRVNGNNAFTDCNPANDEMEVTA